MQIVVENKDAPFLNVYIEDVRGGFGCPDVVYTIEVNEKAEIGKEYKSTIKAENQAGIFDDWGSCGPPGATLASRSIVVKVIAEGSDVEGITN